MEFPNPLETVEKVYNDIDPLISLPVPLSPHLQNLPPQPDLHDIPIQPQTPDPFTQALTEHSDDQVDISEIIIDNSDGTQSSPLVPTAEEYKDVTKCMEGLAEDNNDHDLFDSIVGHSGIQVYYF